MGFLSNFRKDLQSAKKNKAAQINGKNLKELLKKFAQERDRIQKETGERPEIDESTQRDGRRAAGIVAGRGRIGGHGRSTDGQNRAERGKGAVEERTSCGSHRFVLSSRSVEHTSSKC